MPNLSDQFIKSLQSPERGRKILFDAHKEAPAGFGLRITAAGSRAFVLRYNVGGKDRLLTIGEYPTWTLAAARKQAAKYRQEVNGGADVLQARRDERHEATVENVIERYCTAKSDALRSGTEIRQAFAKHVIPNIGRMKLAEVRRRDVIAIVEAIAQTRPRQAAKVLGFIKQLFAWAEDREIVESNPVATLKRANINRAMMPRIRARVLTDDEIRALWVQPVGMSRATWLALRFILATGQRPGEVLKAEASEVHGDVWAIPAEHRGKTNTEQRVPLTVTAKAIIRDAAGEAHLFEYDGHTLTSAAICRAVSRNLAGDPNPWRPHDLRRTMRTRLAEAGVRPDIAELAIGHTKKGIIATYDQAQHADAIRRAMETWERCLLRIVTGEAPKVVKLRAKA